MEIRAELSVSSIGEAIAKLENFSVNVENVCKDIVDYLLTIGEQELINNISSSINGELSSGELLSSIVVENKGTEGFLKVTAPHAVFAEFGIGIKGSGTYPSDSPFKPDGYRTEIWTYKNDKDGKFYNTEGYQAKRFMYNTYMYLLQMQDSAIDYAINKNLEAK